MFVKVLVLKAMKQQRKSGDGDILLMLNCTSKYQQGPFFLKEEKEEILLENTNRRFLL